MTKLYLRTPTGLDYWEALELDGVYMIHWGKLGESGQRKQVKSSLLRSAKKAVQRLIESKKSEGFQEIPASQHQVLVIGYSLEGKISGADVNKRQRLQDRVAEVLARTCLGECHGGSSGGGTIEVCCLVVDFDVAQKVIAAELKGSEFADYARIYREDT